MPEYTPATIAQVDALIGVIRDLQTELTATRVVVEKSLRRSRTAILLSVLSIALIFLAGAGVIVNYQALHAVNQARTEARIVTCIQDNITISQLRTKLPEALLTLVPPGTTLTPDQQARVDAYTESVEMGFPFRDCSPAGIAAYYADLPSDPAD